ncbi:MAG: metalloregulator ArsR/SmtB family transcription factor [Spirochaetia bacterium]|jgi:ArsR family transcriptional regulator|nr:metalloregulator ArsR/SmtB family transcription factor [Spirochaetia bacterium]
MYSTIQKFKALGDENRFRILMMLLQKPLCVCELLEVLDIKGGTLSAHLKLLKTAGLINQKKEGRWIVYSISSEKVKSFLTGIESELENKTIIQNDKTIIKDISRDICSSSN